MQLLFYFQRLEKVFSSIGNAGFTQVRVFFLFFFPVALKCIGGQAEQHDN